MNRKKIKRGPGKQRIEGKQFRLAREINYIQRRAAAYDARFVTVGPLVFFSTQTGDAWMLDPSDRLAARLAREGDPEPIEFQETDTDFAIGWKGNYHIEGRAFVLRRPGSRQDHHDPRLSDCQNCSIRLNGKIPACSLFRVGNAVRRRVALPR